MMKTPLNPPRRRNIEADNQLQSCQSSSSMGGTGSKPTLPPSSVSHSLKLQPTNSNIQNANNEEVNVQNIILIIICGLFLLLQSYGFRNIALLTSGHWSPYSSINDHPTWCPLATCNNTPRCEPCKRRFLIVIATGRSGSTTLMNLLDKLPGVRMAGENKGQLLNDFQTYRNLNESIEFSMKAKEEVEGAWKHFPIPEQALSCPIQGLYEAINPPPELNMNFRGSYDDSETIIGFKTVRLHQALTASVDDGEFEKWDAFFKENFPCARFIFNIRGDIEKQVQSWLLAFGTRLDGNIIRDYNQDLVKLAATMGPRRARVIDMSEWSKDDGSGLAVLNDTLEWLGFRECEYKSLIHSNKDGYGKDTTKLSLGKRCHLKGA